MEEQIVDKGAKVRKIIKTTSLIVMLVGIISFIISSIGLITIGAKDYTVGKYEFREKFLGVEFSVTYILSEDGNFTEFIGEGENVSASTGKWYVQGGAIYICYNDDIYSSDIFSSAYGSESDSSFEKLGEINAVRIRSTNSETGASIDLVCTSMKTRQNVSKTFFVIGLILSLAGAGCLITVNYLNKRKNEEQSQIVNF